MFNFFLVLIFFAVVRRGYKNTKNQLCTRQKTYGLASLKVVLFCFGITRRLQKKSPFSCFSVLEILMHDAGMCDTQIKHLSSPTCNFHAHSRSCMISTTDCFGGGQGGLNVSLPLPCTPGSCPLPFPVLILLQEIVQCYKIYFLFLPAAAPLWYPVSSGLPTSNTSRFLRPCPLHSLHNW